MSLFSWVQRIMRIQLAQSDDAEIVAIMVGELFHEIMVAIGSEVFTFNPEDTEAHVRSCSIGPHRIFLAFEGDCAAGFLALHQGYTMNVEGVLGM